MHCAPLCPSWGQSSTPNRSVYLTYWLNHPPQLELIKYKTHTAGFLFFAEFFKLISFDHNFVDHKKKLVIEVDDSAGKKSIKKKLYKKKLYTNFVE